MVGRAVLIRKEITAAGGSRQEKEYMNAGMMDLVD